MVAPCTYRRFSYYTPQPASSKQPEKAIPPLHAEDAASHQHLRKFGLIGQHATAKQCTAALRDQLSRFE